MEMSLSAGEDIDGHPAQVRIGLLRGNLNATDYQAMKWLEGQLSDEEYAPMRAARQGWRDEINRIEAAEAAEGGAE